VHIQDFGGAPELDVATVIRVNPAKTATTLAVAPNPADYGQAVTLTATVTPSAGNSANNGFVVFLDSGNALGVAAVDSAGVATFTTTRLSVGTHSLTAVFLGTGDYDTSTSGAVQVVIESYGAAISSDGATIPSGGPTISSGGPTIPSGGATIPSAREVKFKRKGRHFVRLDPLRVHEGRRVVLDLALTDHKGRRFSGR
jgi:hypothetical protein